MGVSGLWDLLSPVGHRVSNEHVRNKVLAVDISIWLTQFVKAMRDTEGINIRNAHLLGVLRRCIKLIFLAVKPVLIFDGDTPVLKRRTLAMRNATREIHAAKIRRLAEKLLLNRLKHSSLSRMLPNTSASKGDSAEPVRDSPDPHISPSNVDEIRPDASRPDYAGNHALPMNLAGGDDSDFDIDPEPEWEPIDLPDNLDDIDDGMLVGLPSSMQSEVLKQIKLQNRARHREQMLKRQDDAVAFSQSQIAGFLRNSALNRRLSRVRHVINQNSGASQRIASDSARQFVLKETPLDKDAALLDSDSDDDDDVLAQRGGAAAQSADLLKRIRAEKDAQRDWQVKIEERETRASKPSRRDISGVAWASKVLEGKGGLKLGGHQLVNPIHRKQDDISDDDLSDSLPPDSPNPVAKATANATSAADSDSEDEWEDGAVEEAPFEPQFSLPAFAALAGPRSKSDVKDSEKDGDFQNPGQQIMTNGETCALQPQNNAAGDLSVNRTVPRRMIDLDEDDVDLNGDHELHVDRKKDVIVVTVAKNGKSDDLERCVARPRMIDLDDDDDNDDDVDGGGDDANIVKGRNFINGRANIVDNEKSADLSKGLARRRMIDLDDGDDSDDGDCNKKGNISILDHVTPAQNDTSPKVGSGIVCHRMIDLDDYDDAEHEAYQNKDSISIAGRLKTVANGTSCRMTSPGNSDGITQKNEPVSSAGVLNGISKESKVDTPASKLIVAESSALPNVGNALVIDGALRRERVDVAAEIHPCTSLKQAVQEDHRKYKHCPSEDVDEIAPVLAADSGKQKCCQRDDKNEGDNEKTSRYLEEETEMQIAIAQSMEETNIGQGVRSELSSVLVTSRMSEAPSNILTEPMHDERANNRNANEHATASEKRNAISDAGITNNVTYQTFLQGGEPDEIEAALLSTEMQSPHSKEQQDKEVIERKEIAAPDVCNEVSGLSAGKTNADNGPAMSPEEIEMLQRELEAEEKDIRKQKSSHQAGLETVSDEMYSETRDLLKLLGIPYLQAPMEAEAQCAFLDMNKVVDGIITEDSDSFLFGAGTVYRQLFAEGKFAEVYEASDVLTKLGLGRDKLIRLAHLLGSDYTPGVRGVGVVNSMEILEAFPGEEGLQEFHEWVDKVTLLDEEPEEDVMSGTSQDAVRRRFCWKHRNVKRNWEIRDGFLNPAVSKEYMKPEINESREKFRWGAIDFDGLGKFCWDKFGWQADRFSNYIGPLRKELMERSGPQQRRIDEFFKPHRFAKIRSERLQKAVQGIVGHDAQDLMAAILPKIPKKKRNAVTYVPQDTSGEEEAQMLKALDEVEKKNDEQKALNARNKWKEPSEGGRPKKRTRR